MNFLLVSTLSLVAMVTVEATSPRCTSPAFMKTTCRTDGKLEVISGVDGAAGKIGARGATGVRGPAGVNAKLCSHSGVRTKIACAPFRDNFEKIKDDVRWMASTLDLIEGLDIGSMTKEELIKIIISQNDKIVNDHDTMDDMDKEMKKLKKKLRETADSLSVIEKLRKQLKKQVGKNAEKDKKIKDLHKKIAEISANLGGNEALKKEIKDLKATIDDLNEKLKKAQDSAAAFKKLHGQIKKIYDELKVKTKGLEDEVARLKEQLRKKNIANKELREKVAELQSQITETRKACKKMQAQNVQLVEKLEALKKTCNGNQNSQGEVIKQLRNQIVNLKRRCKDIAAYINKINDLEAKLQELSKKKAPPAPRTAPEVKFPKNSILCAGDESKAITTILNSDISIFKKYKKSNIELPCVKATDGTGPWFVLLNRQDGSVDFKQNFESYRNGFGDPKGEFWLGLDAARALTSKHAYQLRVELEDHKGNKRYAVYRKFGIGSGSGYRLKISGYEGNVYNALLYHQNQRFSTFDKDQDATRKRNCAHDTGGWWYKKCHTAALTGKWHSTWTDDKHGIRWRAAKSKAIYHNYYSWKKARMLIQPKK